MNSRLPPRILYALGCALVLSIYSLTPRSTFAQPSALAEHAGAAVHPSASAAVPTGTAAPPSADADTAASATAQPRDGASEHSTRVQPSEAAAVESVGARSSEHMGVVNLNTATASELERLPRIGPARAQAILALRAKLARFSKVEQLLRVKGIGRATFRKLRPMLALDGPTTLPERKAR